jgi:hypothetical protein
MLCAFGAIAFPWYHAQIYLQPVAEPHHGARRPSLHHLRHVLVANEALHDRFARLGGDHDVEDADRLAPPPVAAGHLRLAQAGRLPEMIEQGYDDLFRRRELHARSRPGALGDCFQHPGFDHGSYARQLP